MDFSRGRFSSSDLKNRHWGNRRYYSYNSCIFLYSSIPSRTGPALLFSLSLSLSHNLHDVNFALLRINVWYPISARWFIANTQLYIYKIFLSVASELDGPSSHLFILELCLLLEVLEAGRNFAVRHFLFGTR